MVASKRREPFVLRGQMIELIYMQLTNRAVVQFVRRLLWLQVRGKTKRKKASVALRSWWVFQGRTLQWLLGHGGASEKGGLGAFKVMVGTQ